MNFSQMHERLRLELLRRIERGTVSVSLLARQTGLAPAHVSNFLHGRRRLSLSALDTVLTAQHLEPIDLLPSFAKAADGPSGGEWVLAPMVSHGVMLLDPILRAGARQRFFPIRARVLEELRPRCLPARRRWERFIVYCAPPIETVAMEPVLNAGCAVLIDRHYTSPQAYRPGRKNLYAVRLGARVALRYVEFQASCLLLRPCNAVHPIELIELSPDRPPEDHIVGRVALTVNEC